MLKVDIYKNNAIGSNINKTDLNDLQGIIDVNKGSC